MARILTTRARDRKLIIGLAVGTDHIDLEYCRQNGIQVMNCTNCNSETVAEHAISLVRTHLPIHDYLLLPLFL